MVFASSSTPDITEALPASLSRGSSESTALKRSQIRWDIAIDGIGFILGANDQNPYVRETAPWQKDQFDASAEAGEQTLDGLWIRSQTSWHLGSGAKFYEPGTRDSDATPSRYRFDKGVGVNVWGEGDITLLKKMSASTAANAGVCYVTGSKMADGSDVFFSVASGGQVRRHTAAGVVTAYTNPSSGQLVTRATIAGTQVLAGTATAIAAGPISGSAMTDLWTGAPATPTPYWVKSRIVATAGASVYELTMVGGAFPADPLYTHPDSGWTWTGVAEGPQSVMLSGYAGGRGVIYALSLEDGSSGNTPKLGQPYQVAEFPPGEEVHSIHTYLGTYVGIGTSRGLRIGILGNRGEIQYGPLLFETAEPVRSLSARDSFLYAAVSNVIDGLSGAARVDLGHQINDGLVFPWAWDAQAKVSGTAQSISFVGTSDRVVLGVASQYVYVQSATDYEDSGYLQSGSIRFGTTEGKAFRFADVRCQTVNGSSVSLSIVGPTKEEIPVVTLSSGTAGSNLSLAGIASNLEYVAYRLLLRPSSDKKGTPTVESVALKAMPVVKRQRLIQYPVLMQEKQQDGMKVPFQRNVAELIAQIELAEETKAVVQVMDFRLGESFPALIEKVRFINVTPSTGSLRGGNNAGGRGEITVRKL